MGSAFESKKEAGYSHFTEHLVFKSTNKYPENSIMDEIANYGGSLNAYTSHETTCFNVTLPSEYLEKGIELLAELVQHACFTDKDFENEKKVVIEELKQYRNDPEEYFIETIPSLATKNSPYIPHIIGNLVSLNKAKPEDLRGFYKKFYHPENSFICLAGDFDLDILKEHIDRYFLNWRKDTCAIVNNHRYEEIQALSFIETQYCSKTNKLINKNITHHKSEIDRDILAFTIPELSYNDPKSITQSMIFSVFAGGQTSRLYQRLFLKEQLIDNIKIYSMVGIYNGTSTILIYPKKNEYIDKILEIFLEEYNELNRFGLKIEELDNIKKELLNSSGYVYEYMDNLAQTLASYELLKDYKTFFKYNESIENITKQDVKNVITQFFQLKNLKIITAGKYKHMYKSTISSGSTSVKPLSNIFVHTMENGLKILFKKTDGKNICGISLSLGVSQLNENEENLGINHLTSSLLIYGNQNRSYNEILKFCTQNGINLSVRANKETTNLRLKCFTDSFNDSLELLCDIYSTPLFPLEYINTIKNTFISDIQRVKDFPQKYALKQWREMLFGKQSNILYKGGTVKTLRKINRQNILDWYQNQIRKAPATICIVGDFDFDSTLFKLEKLFSNFNFTKVMPFRPIFISPSKENKVVRNRKQDQSVIFLSGFCTPNNIDEVRTPMEILSEIIGGDGSSRLFNTLREEYGLAYYTSFDYELLQGLGYYGMVAIVDRDREKQAINMFRKIQLDIKNKGATTDELYRIKNYLKGQRRIYEESTVAQATMISTLLTLGYEYDYYQKREERINNVSNKQIIEIANDYFKEEDEFLFVLH
jgi:zinc protease